ncbi:hypothetical protein OA92_21300 [Marinomonas sp. SBI22]|uniref:hypothetical protein n=1 Tax=unclassified Marinomonas TaxID=196814 RepID=UPI0007AFC33D|nr:MULTISPECIES: hypothetical protein [unclassified Marinomonas]KZM39133.1 hypothetical protein OA92_21300 [Marinomonas sp. SBI22]KZM39917.1 hypothetical protein OA91_21155 [Marinomonas sp. SBI8L]
MFAFQERVIPTQEQDSRNKVGVSTTPALGEEASFLALMGKSASGIGAISKINSDLLTNRLINQIPPFNNNENMRFDVFFPDGVKVSVLSKNTPQRLELTMKSNSQKLSKQLNNCKRKTQGDLDAYFGKQVLINVV